MTWTELMTFGFFTAERPEERVAKGILGKDCTTVGRFVVDTAGEKKMRRK